MAWRSGAICAIKVVRCISVPKGTCVFITFFVFSNVTTAYKIFHIFEIPETILVSSTWILVKLLVPWV